MCDVGTLQDVSLKSFLEIHSEMDKFYLIPGTRGFPAWALKLFLFVEIQKIQN